MTASPKATSGCSISPAIVAGCLIVWLGYVNCPAAAQETTAPSIRSEPLQELEQLEDTLVGSLATIDRDQLNEIQGRFARLEKQVASLALEGTEKNAMAFAIARIQRLFEKLDTNRPQQADASLKQLVHKLPQGDPVRLEALEMLLFDRAERLEIDYDLTANYFLEIAGLEHTDDSLFQNLQFSSVEAIYVTITKSVEQAAEPGARLNELDQRLTSSIQHLRERGVPANVARLLRFGVVLLSEQQNDLGRLEKELRDLHAVVCSEGVAELWRALYWNKWLEQHIRRRRYGEAFAASRHLLQCAEKMNSEEIYVIGMSQLAHLSLRLGDYTTAKRILSSERLAKAYEQSLDAGKICTWKVNLAKALEGELNIFSARALLTEARRYTENSTDPEGLRLLVDNNLGVNHYLAGELEMADRLLGQCLETQRARPQVNRVPLAEAMINVGWAKLAKLDYAAAQQQFADAANLIEQDAGHSHPRYIEALANSARALALVGKIDHAADLIQRAEKLSFAVTSDYLNASWSGQDRLAIVQEARVHPESIAWPGVLDTYLEIAPQLDIPAAVQAKVVLRWKGLLDAYDARDREAIPAAVRDRERQLLESLREAYFRKVPLSQRNRLQQELRELEDKLRELRREPSTTSQTSSINASYNRSTELDAHNLPQLAPGEVLLDIIQIRRYRLPQVGQVGSEGEFIAFVQTAGGDCHRVSLGPANKLESLIDQWRTAITSETENERELAREIGNLVQRPLLQVAGNFQRLVIKPDAGTYLLPWCALPGTNNTAYWIEDIEIELTRSTHNSSRIAPTSPGPNHATLEGNSPSTTSPKPADSLLLVGNVDFGKLSDQWPPLPQTATEIESIANLFSKAYSHGITTRLEGKQADRSRVITELHAHKHIHLATHGFFLRREATDAFTLSTSTSLFNSGLVLAEPEPEDTSREQYLSAAEIAPLNLHDCESVLLSACETGLGKLRAGQGIEGLVSSFQSAGAKRVVGSLWKVPDRPTSLLATRFYFYLWEKQESYPQALRHAQLDLLNAVNPEMHEPGAWAAFFLSTAAHSR